MNDNNGSQTPTSTNNDIIEKLISNLFLITGLGFIVAGFVYLFIFIFNNFI